MANKKITDFAASGALDGTELVELVKAGANVKGTMSNVAAFVAAAIVTEATAARTALPAHAGNYTRFTNTGAKTYTFDSAQSYVVGTEFHLRNAAASNLTLTVGGTFAFNSPYLGSLVVPPGGTATVKIVAANVADVFGVTL
ncbi:MAG: hypothetical protein ACREXP_12550 [Steroidobacteraceae bacterium]